MSELSVVESEMALLRLNVFYEIKRFKEKNIDKFHSKGDLNRAVRKHINNLFKRQSEHLFLCKLKIIDSQQRCL